MNFNLNNESFSIEPELEISRIINNHSNKIYTIKNYDDMYDYDLVVKDKELNIFLGFIEIEKSNYNYLGGKNWYHSFLKRKIFEFDRINNCFTNRLKDNAYKTIYFKVNKNFGLNDCICCDMKTLSHFPIDYQNKTDKDYNNLVVRTTMDDKRVKIGINECIDYMEKFFII